MGDYMCMCEMNELQSIAQAWHKHQTDEGGQKQIAREVDALMRVDKRDMATNYTWL